MRCNFMGRQLIDNTKITWLSLFLGVILYYYCFSIVEYITKAHIYFLSYDMTLIITYVHPSTTSHWSLINYSHAHWTRQRNTYLLFTQFVVFVEILYYVTLLTNSEWVDSEIHTKMKGILYTDMYIYTPVYTAFSIDCKIVSVKSCLYQTITDE